MLLFVLVGVVSPFCAPPSLHPLPNGTQFKFRLQRNRPICLSNENVTYTFTLKHSYVDYGIRWKYRFTLPSMTHNCTCDCPGGTSLCPLIGGEFNRVLLDGSSHGCDTKNEAARVCCDVHFEPQMTYWAVKTGDPSQSHVVNIRIETYQDGEPHESNKIITDSITLDNMTFYPRHMEVRSGEVYIFEEGTTDLRQGADVAPSDYPNFFDKLGWMRNSSYFPTSQLASKLTIDVEHCQKQEMRLISTIHGLAGDENALGHPMSLVDPRVVGVRIEDRRIRMDLTGGEVEMSVRTSQEVEPVFHRSSLGDFSGYVYESALSHLLLVLRFTETSGDIVGEVSSNCSLNSSNSSSTSSQPLSVFVWGEVFYVNVSLVSANGDSLCICVHAQLGHDTCKQFNVTRVPLVESLWSPRLVRVDGVVVSQSEFTFPGIIGGFLGTAGKPLAEMVPFVVPLACVALSLALVWVVSRLVIPLYSLLS